MHKMTSFSSVSKKDHWWPGTLCDERSVHHSVVLDAYQAAEVLHGSSLISVAEDLVREPS